MDTTAAPAFDPWACPRCGKTLTLIDGWIEYGDQLVEIQRIGCWGCGYACYEEGDDPEDEEFL